MSKIPTKQIDGDVAVSRNVSAGGNATVRGTATVGHNLKVEGWLDAPNVKGPNKGLFATGDKLNEAYPQPEEGWWALVGNTLPAQIYISDGGEWIAQTNADGTPKLGGNPTIDATSYMEEVEGIARDLEATKTDLEAAKIEIGENKEDIGELQTRQTTQDGQIAEMQKAVEAAQNQADKGVADAAVAQTAASDAQRTANAAQSKANSNEQRIDTLLNGDGVTAAIDTFNELVAFLEGVENEDTFLGLLNEIRESFNGLSGKHGQLSKTVADINNELLANEMAYVKFIDLNTIVDNGANPYTSLTEALAATPEDWRQLGAVVRFWNETTDALGNRVQRWETWQWRKTAYDEDADWENIAQWEPFGVSATGEALDDLPFTFNKGDMPDADTPNDHLSWIYFDRTRDYFFDYQGQPVGAPYNVTDLNGKRHANTERIFRCGQQRYRYVGRQLVNIAIEQNPHTRFVARCPSLNAHPGIVYKNTGRIRIPTETGNTISVSFRLDGLYYENEGLTALSTRPIVFGANMGKYKQTAKELTPTISSKGTYTVTPEGGLTERSVYITLPFDEKDYRGIACRYDVDGNKIFYPVECPPIKRKLAAPTLDDLTDCLEANWADTGYVHSGWLDLLSTAFKNHFEIQVYAKAKHSVRQRGGSRYQRPMQYRWRYFFSKRKKFIERDKIWRYVGATALIRIRRIKNYAKSEWSYFHVNFEQLRITYAKTKAW